MSASAGRVISRFGAELLLLTTDDDIIRATARRKLDSLVCGDRVEYEQQSGTWIVTAMLERKNALERTYFRGQTRTMAANIDQVLVISALKPETDWNVVNGALIAAERLHADAIILHHKFDLGSSEEMEQHLDDYRRIGYTVLDTSIEKPESIEALEARLSQQTAILLGQSGMGKSSLVEQLVAEAKIKIGHISETTGLGRHTTSVTQLYPIPGGGYLIDSPGIRDFTPPPLPPEELQYAFREFVPLIGQCRFHNCQHHKEPGCAIRAAVDQGEISQFRYAGYLTQLQIWLDSTDSNK
ncbi:MAG: ribosome small subunit-dependent GTPase A [bacterium]